jgi:hypothetical protein
VKFTIVISTDVNLVSNSRRENNMIALLSRLRSEAGMTTAEYAVGTCAAAGLGGILIKILTSSVFYDIILSVLKHAFGFLFN